jgi:hypothetical protein
MDDPPTSLRDYLNAVAEANGLEPAGFKSAVIEFLRSSGAAPQFLLDRSRLFLHPAGPAGWRCTTCRQPHLHYSGGICTSCLTPLPSDPTAVDPSSDYYAYLECPRFGGHLSAWSALSGWAGRMRRYAEGIELSQAVLAGVPA